MNVLTTNLTRQAPGNGLWRDKLPPGERYWTMNRDTWLELKPVCLEIEKVVDRSRGAAKEISRRLDGMLAQARIFHKVNPLIVDFYDPLSEIPLDEKVHRATEILHNDVDIPKNRIEDLELHKGLLRLIRDIRKYLANCEIIEQKFIDLFAKTGIQHVLDQPDPGWLIQQVGGWIHYPNCNIGGRTLSAANTMADKFRFKDLADFAIEWHRALASRILRRPEQFKFRLNADYDIEKLGANNSTY